QVTSSFQHLLLPKRKWLALGQDQKTLEDDSYLQKRTSSHFVGVFLKAIFPIRMVIAFSIHQKTQDLIDLADFHDGTETHVPDIAKRNFYFEAAGFDLKKIEFLDRGTYCPTTDLLDDSHAVIRINNFVADLEV